MQGPFAVTLETLSETTSPEAIDLLVYGMQSTYESISIASGLSLADRHGMNGQREVLRHFAERTPAFRQTLQARSEKFDSLLRQSLLQGTSEQRAEALRGVVALQAVEQIPQLILLLTRDDLPEIESVAETLRELSSLVDDAVRVTSVTDMARNAVISRRDRALAGLDQSLGKFNSIQIKDAVVESILVLGPATHPTVKKALWQADLDCRDRAGRMLLESAHPKIMRQVIDSLKQSYPHPKAFDAVRSRTDLEFISELLRAVAAKSGAMFEQNLRQIESLAWLEVPEPPLGLIPQHLQPALLTLAFMTRIYPERRALVQDWLLHNGGPAGRMAAAERAAVLDDHVMQNVLVDSLDAEDEQVQAWAVTQLRQHAVPEAFGLLVQRLDSASASVRAAAKTELSDFNLERVLGLMDALDAATALRVGEIVRKIDEQATAKLERELSSAIRPKRIIAARAVIKLGFLPGSLPALLKLADDEDFMIRRTLAEVLAAVTDPEVLTTLDRLAQDGHPRVRDAAAQAIERWERHSAEQLDPLLVQ